MGGMRAAHSQLAVLASIEGLLAPINEITIVIA